MSMRPLNSALRRGFGARGIKTVASLMNADFFVDKGLIGGEWSAAASSKEFEVADPATGSVLASVPAMDSEDANRAVEEAANAFTKWKRSSLKDRASLVKRWSDELKKNVEDLSLLVCLENGKSLVEARGEVLYAISYLDFFAGERANGLVIPSPVASQRLLTTKEPVGVCSLITPWNFPLAMIARKAAPALMAGCSMVIKPAEDTPLVALALAKLGVQAGVPAGVINVVTTPRTLASEVGTVLSRHKEVRKVSFTGSTAVGKLLLEQAAGTVKRTSMELGGNAPFVVFDDADVDKAVENAISARFRVCGQTCISANRFLVQERVHEEFCAKLASRIAGLKVGNGQDRLTSVGPLINGTAKDKVAGLVGDALSHGAVALVGGELSHEMGPNFFSPTLLTGCPPQARICTEEIFGPVANVVNFTEEDEALSSANSSLSGLAGYVFTQDLSRGLRFAEGLEVGMVGINDCNISKNIIPFGGVKESGMGREGSVLGLDEYLETKHICIGGL